MVEKFNCLTENEAKIRLDKYGFNEIEDKNKVSPFKILFRQIKGNFIIYLLVFSMILSFVVGEPITGYVVIVVILLVVVTGFVQEYKAEKSIEKLKEMIMSVSIVLRDGREREVPTKELVPGDVVLLRTGEKVPADCVILTSKNLLVNESALTGESDEIKKTSTSNVKTDKKENLIFVGSFIIDGKCTAQVLHTGMNTEFGKIAGMISSAEKELPLQKKTNQLSKFMAIFGISIAVFTGLITLLRSSPINSEAIVSVIILVIAMSISSFPEGLPVVFITNLSIGASRMAKKNAIVNRMSIIETLGETTVICSDKTGTITKGEMTVKKIFVDNKMVDVSGVGYDTNGEFLLDGNKIDIQKNKTLKILLKTAVVCNDARIERIGDESNTFNVLGTPTESALLVMAAKGGFKREDFNERIDEIPFSSERKVMHVIQKEGGKRFLYSKGAPEYILKSCKYILRDNGVFRLLERDKQKILKEKSLMTSNCLRTIGFAYKEITSSDINKEASDGLIFLGFGGMEDPAREGIKDALEICREAGIKIKMITGDDKETAIAIAKQINLDHGRVLEGYQIDSLTDKQLFKIVKNTVIFARVKPEHKLKIVKALKEDGEIVTMTGDGVNDAPALKEAHIGVAMGKNGTDVSRSVADLTLKDDNFVTLVDAIKEGRTIFSNIRKFVTYDFSDNFSELFILFIGVLLAPKFGWPTPLLLALQILFMNIVTDNLPAITLGLNPSSTDIMKEQPRKNTSIMNKDLIISFLLVGTIMGLFSLGSFYIAFNVFGDGIVEARTTALLTLIFLEIGAAFNFRSFRKPTLSRSLFTNPQLFIASGISILASILIINIPFLNVVFGTVPLTFLDWMICVGLTFVSLLIYDILKRVNNKKHYIKFD